MADYFRKQNFTTHKNGGKIVPFPTGVKQKEKAGF